MVNVRLTPFVVTVAVMLVIQMLLLVTHPLLFVLFVSR
jgi:hypothetical protein